MFLDIKFFLPKVWTKKILDSKFLDINITATQSTMKLNQKKTKLIVFNPCRSLDFMPNICLDEQELEVVEEIKLLGLTIRSDMKWVSNTENMVKKANKRLWLIRRLKNLGANNEQLVDVY